MRRTPLIALIALLIAPFASSSAQALKVLNLPDYGRWNRVTSTALSPDGKWMSYAYQPNDGDATLFVKQLDGDKVFTIPIGSAPAAAGGGGGGGGGGAGGAQFSDDSRFVAYYVNPPEPAGGRGGAAGGGGRGGRGGAPPAGAPAGGARATRRLEILDLTTGDKFPVPNAASFKFAKGSAWLAVRLNKTPADTAFKGGDLVLRDLKSSTTRNTGNVNRYDFDDSGRMLAYTVDAAGHFGNGVYLMNLATGETRELNSSTQEYDQLAWSDDGSGLVVLRGEKSREMKQRDNTLLAWTGVGTPNAKPLTLDPAKDASLRGMVVSEYTPPRFSKDGSRIFLGIKEQEPELAAADSLKANVDVWHWKDPEPQTVQVVRIQQERRATLPAAYLVASQKVVKLGDDDMRTAANTPNGKWAIGRNDVAAYRGSVEWGASRADMYRVNTETGERTLIDKTLSRTMGTSPDSKWFLYLKDKKVRAFNLETARTVDIDAGPAKSFLNEDDDHPYEIPVWGVGGWSKDGNSVLLYDKFDVWQLSLTGGKPVNLTAGIGRAQQIEFRVVRLGAGGRGGRGGGGGRGGAAGEDEGLDLSMPVLLSAYGERSKKSGYWQVTAGQPPKPLLWADKEIAGVQKSENADRVMFTEQTFTEFPDYWVSDASFTSPKKVTDANPFIK